MIDEILENNRRFVAGKGNEKHITDGKPLGKTLIVTCTDTRLSVMQPEALGIIHGQTGDAKGTSPVEDETRTDDRGCRRTLRL